MAVGGGGKGKIVVVAMVEDGGRMVMMAR